MFDQPSELSLVIYVSVLIITLRSALSRSPMKKWINPKFLWIKYWEIKWQSLELVTRCPPRKKSSLRCLVSNRRHVYYCLNDADPTRLCNEVDWCWEWMSTDSKVHGANMGPIWGRQDPGGPHVGPMNLAIWEMTITINKHSAYCTNWDMIDWSGSLHYVYKTFRISKCMFI